MVVYKFSDIPKELLVDQSYTLRQIRLFLLANKDCTFLHKDINYLDGESRQRVTVISKDEYYIHQHSDRSYLYPNEKKVIYFLSDSENSD